MNIAKIIDEHRIVSTAFGTTREGRSGRWATCLCGTEIKSFYDEQSVPIDEEHNPERDVQRKHAAHVAEMVEKSRTLITSGVRFCAVERSAATKFQIQAYEREHPELAVQDLLKRAAHEILKHGGIPTQIKIDRAPAGQGEKITLTWFA